MLNWFDLKWMFCILSTFYFGKGFNKQYLHSSWTVRNVDSSINICATVPGGIYSDLMTAQIINDIYYRFNDINYRWVGNETWIYTTYFDVGNHILNKNKIILVFEGIDTFSHVWLNNIKIGTTNNMFIKYSFNIKKYLQCNQNNLTIEIISPISESKKLYEEQSKHYLVPPTCVPKVYNGECHVNHIRKMQASFSWDWGPAFPSVGLWKPVFIESYNSVVIQGTTFHLTDGNEVWNINLQVFFKSDPHDKINGVIATQLNTNVNVITTLTDTLGTFDEQGEYKQNVYVSFPKIHVDLWWPNGFGNQKLYDLKLTYYPKDYSEMSIKKVKIGFRTVELVQNDTGNGLSFYFNINNVPIFMKGSNWIPANVLPEKGANEGKIRYLLQSAKDVHMNMLRVWGGGVYESDLFYDIADELGILIWQDFMFACSMYPVNKKFLESVKIEVMQQVQRLQYHPCIALWAGNNENEAALRGNWYGTNSNFKVYKNDYVKLYVDTIKPIVNSIDKTRMYLTSSPSNGLESEQEGYVAKNPYDGHFGDVHYYNYILDGWNPNIYPKTRFASEYGYQSLPAIETLTTATNLTEDLKYDSEFLNSRQHHLAGYSQMKILMNKHLHLPSAEKESFLKTFIYYSQISQAMSIKIETEFYRQWQNKVDETGNGLTFGALYWQLNDVWQAPSWASIDFKQNWKMLHYYAKKFFSPILISSNINSSRDLTISVISDLLVPVNNATLEICVFKWDSLIPIKTNRSTISFLRGVTQIEKSMWIDEYLMNAGCGSIADAKNKCLIYLKLLDHNNIDISDNFIFPTVLKLVEGLKSPDLKVKVTKSNSPNIFIATTTTDTITPFVWLETSVKGKFSENGFIQTNANKNVIFSSEQTTTTDELQSTLRVTSVFSKEHL